MFFNLAEILPTIGYLGIFAIVFSETGLFVGFFLPGDSLLFTAGFLASQGIFNIFILATGCFIAAVVGNTTGYMFGKRVGKRLFHRQDSIFFHKDNLERAKSFYVQHGKKTIIFAQFIPVIRTFAPIVAGIGDMHYPTFIAYNVIGAVFWAIGVTLSGYFFGRVIPSDLMEKYLILIILAIIFLSLSPTVYHILKEKESRGHLLALFKKYILKR